MTSITRKVRCNPTACAAGGVELLANRRGEQEHGCEQRREKRHHDEQERRTRDHGPRAGPGTGANPLRH
ncbi:MAG: hypothetical protein WBV74_07340 [Pseudonocardiaceae bacterium]